MALAQPTIPSPNRLLPYLLPANIAHRLSGAAPPAARWLRWAITRPAWGDAGALGVVVGMAVALLWEGVAHGAVRWQDDTKYFYYPLLAQVAQALRAGRLPLWEPGLFGGYPLFADGESGMLYPLHLLVLPWLSPAPALVLLRLLRLSLAGAFTYAFGRALGLGRTGALVGALAFEGSGFLLGQTVHENLADGMVWLPPALYFVERAARAPAFARQARLAAGTGVALAVQALAVHVQVCVLSALVVAPYLTWRGLFPPTPPLSTGAPRRGGLPGRLGRVAALGLVVGLVAAGLAAVQMLPLLELAGRSARGHGISLDAATINSVTPFRLLTVFFPHLLQQPNGASFGHWVDWEVTIYVGVPALFLAIVACAMAGLHLFGSRSRAHHLPSGRVVLFFALVAGFSLVLSTGRYGPDWVVTIVQDLLGERGLRSPGRFAFLWSFAAAVLAAAGVDWLDRRASAPGPEAGGRGEGFARLWFAAVCALLSGVSAGLLLATRAAYEWITAHPDATRRWLERRYFAFDPEAGPKTKVEAAYQGLVAALDPSNPQTVVWVVSVVAGYALLVAWFIAGRTRGAEHRRWGSAWTDRSLVRPALRVLTVVVVAAPLIIAAARLHPTDAIAAIEPNSGAARYLQSQLAPPGTAENGRPLYRVYASQPVYLYQSDVEPNALLPLGIQEAGGYSSLSTSVNLGYGWAAELSQGRMLDVWNVRYYLWPNKPEQLPSFELTSFHPQRPLVSGSGANTGAAAAFRVPAAVGENVRVIAALRDAWAVPDGAVVAWITATDDQGATHRWPLRAGVDLLEATAAPPVPLGTPAADRHAGLPLPVFSWEETGPGGKPVPVYLYYAKLPLEETRAIVRLGVLPVLVPAASEAIVRVYGLGVGQPDWWVHNVSWADRERFTLVYQDEETLVYRNERALPRAYLVPVAVPAPRELHLKEMAERGFDPERMLLVNAALDAVPEGPTEPYGAYSWAVRQAEGRRTEDEEDEEDEAAVPVATEVAQRPVMIEDDLGRKITSLAGEATVREYTGDRITIAVDAHDASWLFLGDTFHPAWRAHVDGVPRRVYEANAMFRAVAVPAGKHEVVFRYEPASLQWGALITLTTGVAILLFAGSLALHTVWSGTARRKDPANPAHRTAPAQES
ncbi:MAG: YfhO family protein [Chloroflexi bacterium]|nr:YfhO family protein [Chloroflexota bacterium]